MEGESPDYHSMRSHAGANEQPRSNASGSARSSSEYNLRKNPKKASRPMDSDMTSWLQDESSSSEESDEEFGRPKAVQSRKNRRRLARTGSGHVDSLPVIIQALPAPTDVLATDAARSLVLLSRDARSAPNLEPSAKNPMASSSNAAGEFTDADFEAAADLQLLGRSAWTQSSVKKPEKTKNTDEDKKAVDASAAESETESKKSSLFEYPPEQALGAHQSSHTEAESSAAPGTGGSS